MIMKKIKAAPIPMIRSTPLLNEPYCIYICSESTLKGGVLASSYKESIGVLI